MQENYNDIDINQVLDFATKKHEGQTRDDGSPYIVHPKRVCAIVEKYKSSNNINLLKAGALLHDTLEDTYTSYRELKENFGEIVASLVMEVTSASFMPKLVGKQVYLANKMAHMSNYALVIKLADRLDNISDLKGCNDEKIKKTFFDTIYIINFIQNQRTLTNTQKNLVNAIWEQLRVLNNQYHLTDDMLLECIE